MTPNKVEFERLVEACTTELSATTATTTTVTPDTNSTNKTSISVELQGQLLSELRSSDIRIQVRAVSIVLGGVTIMKKGEEDILSNGDVVYTLQSGGSPRRCGGQGDILAGCLAVAAYWSSQVIYLYTNRQL